MLFSAPFHHLARFFWKRKKLKLRFLGRSLDTLCNLGSVQAFRPPPVLLASRQFWSHSSQSMAASLQILERFCQKCGSYLFSNQPHNIHDYDT